MFRRMWSYLKTLFGMKAEALMDPAVQIEQAVNEAREQDQKLREQAARVVANRSELQMKLDRAADSAAKAKRSASQAIMNLDAAQKQGDAAGVDKWQRTAQALALDLETQERLVEGLKQQFTVADEQAELAKRQVTANALRLKELTAKRMELLGKLEQARMQEQVNKTLESLNRPIDGKATPTLNEVEDKINKRMALATAKAELESNSIEGAQRELEESMAQASGMGRLDSLRAELGLGGGEAPAATPAGGDGQTLLTDGVDDTAADLEKLRDKLEAEPVQVESDKA